MEEQHIHEKNTPNSRFQSMLQCLTKCKHDYKSEREESTKLRNVNVKLENELKETRELEKSHRYHLLTSREMIGNLQETVSQLVYLKRDVKRLKDEITSKDSTVALLERTVSQLVYLKRDVKRLKDEITSKDSTVALLERERDSMLQKHNETVEELRNAHKQEIEELSTKWDKKAQQIQYDSDTQIAQYTCVIEELRNKLKETEAEHREKMNVLVLEYEEKVQRSVAQASQLQDQLARQAAHTDANIDAYRRKLEELEEKLKQQQFKEYLAHNKYTSQHDNRGERPYSVERDPYAQSSSVIYDHTSHSQKILASPSVVHVKNQKPAVNTLQVMYQGSKTSLPKANEKKGQFNITKKRKLFNEKDFLNM